MVGDIIISMAHATSVSGFGARGSFESKVR